LALDLLALPGGRPLVFFGATSSSEFSLSSSSDLALDFFTGVFFVLDLSSASELDSSPDSEFSLSFVSALALDLLALPGGRPLVFFGATSSSEFSLSSSSDFEATSDSLSKDVSFFFSLGSFFVIVILEFLFVTISSSYFSLMLTIASNSINERFNLFKLFSIKNWTKIPEPVVKLLSFI